MDREAQNRSRGDFSSQRFQGFQGGGFDRFRGGFGGVSVAVEVDSVATALVAVRDLAAVALAALVVVDPAGLGAAGDDEN